MTRFCILCNYVSRIIDPIKSRCARFRYQPLSAASITGRLQLIARQEGVRLEEERQGEEPLSLICELSGGDMRQAITLLQTASRLMPQSAEARLTRQMVMDVSCATPPAFIQQLHGAVRANSWQRVQAVVEEMQSAGYDSQSVLQGWLPVLLADAEIAEERKAAICLHIAETESRLVDGSEEFLQMLDLLAFASHEIHTQ